MGKSPLILAALAKDAVPALDFVQVTPLSGDSVGFFDSALLTASTGAHYVIRMARGQQAGLALDTELMVLRALSAYRSRLPFEMTKLVGETKDAYGKRALLFSYVYGQPTDIARLGGDDALSTSLADTLAAIHSLPLGVVEDSGMPIYSPADVIRSRTAELDRFAQTGKVPAVLLSRWETALEDVNLWRFNPTVIHGDVSGDNFVHLNGAISGVMGWQNLCIGDPAEDFSWILGTGGDEFSYNVLLEYGRLRGTDDNLRARAQLYSEMEYGRWLMHGIESGDDAIVDDAISMLQIQVTDLESGNLPSIGPKPLAPATAAVFAGDAFGDEVDGFETTAFAAAEPVAAAEFVDVAQAVVVDEFVLNPFADAEQSDTDAETAAEPAESLFAAPGSKSRVGTDEDYVFDASAPVTEPVNIFAAPDTSDVDDATKPIPLPVFEDDAATTEIPVVAEASEAAAEEGSTSEASAEETEESDEPKNGELF